MSLQEVTGVFLKAAPGRHKEQPQNAGDGVEIGNVTTGREKE